MLVEVFYARSGTGRVCCVAESHGRVHRDRGRVASALRKDIRITNNKNVNVPLNKS